MFALIPVLAPALTPALAPATGAHPHVLVQGVVAPHQMTIRHGQRESTYTAFLKPAMERSNLTVRLSSLLFLLFPYLFSAVSTLSLSFTRHSFLPSCFPSFLSFRLSFFLLPLLSPTIFFDFLGFYFIFLLLPLTWCVRFRSSQRRPHPKS
jgi:hypothetical protein